jgi:hypothetical protein
MKKHVCLSIGILLLAVSPAQRQQVSAEMLETLQKWMAEVVTGGAK